MLHKLLTFAVTGLALLQAGPAASEIRKPAAVFTLPGADGKPVELSRYKGSVVLLNFWATDCGGCKKEIPWFVEYQEKYKGQGLVVIGASMDESWAPVKVYLKTHNINYPVVLAGGELPKKYGGIESLPATFLIDRNQHVAAIYRGLIDREKCESRIRALLAER